jgi:hypothetical protein
MSELTPSPECEHEIRNDFAGDYFCVRCKKWIAECDPSFSPSPPYDLEGSREDMFTSERETCLDDHIYGLSINDPVSVAYGTL